MFWYRQPKVSLDYTRTFILLNAWWHRHQIANILFWGAIFMEQGKKVPSVVTATGQKNYWRSYWVFASNSSSELGPPGYPTIKCYISHNLKDISWSILVRQWKSIIQSLWRKLLKLSQQDRECASWWIDQLQWSGSSLVITKCFRNFSSNFYKFYFLHRMINGYTSDHWLVILF